MKGKIESKTEPTMYSLTAKLPKDLISLLQQEKESIRLEDYIARDTPQLSKHGQRLYPTDNIETIECCTKQLICSSHSPQAWAGQRPDNAVFDGCTNQAVNREFVFGMEQHTQRNYYAVLMDAKIKLKKEECASGMGQEKRNVVSMDA